MEAIREEKRVFRRDEQEDLWSVLEGSVRVGDFKAQIMCKSL